ncbi:hypothetical protein [Jiangella alkaliphila]|uniref:Right handed beta helix region n=1 Tax=Jiangella alkaliphila TaxID=419479 RepID=A0A1H2L9U6_9ACTN|nr:hypothetical protein [Jiangella alkaliphila]SDU77602.1 hypothetical protein SAMN04488563_5586 [Jiangella alkaliphila]
MSTFTRRALVTAATAGAAAGVVASAPPAAAARPGPRSVFAVGEVETTMDPAATGAANAAAFMADVASAEGRQIVVPPGTYTVGQVAITGETIDVRFMPGTLLVPAASLHAVGPAGKWFQATNCDTRLHGLVVDGQNIPEGCWRSDGGELRMYDTRMTNLGFLDLTGNSTSLGTFGITVKNVQEVVVDGYVGRDFVGRKDGVYANQAGKVNHLFVYECERVTVRNLTTSGGEGEDNDFVHMLDQRATPTMHGSFENCRFLYNGQTRRCMKFQGGNWSLRDIHCYRGPDFVAVSANTDVGEQNLNCIDFAGSLGGTVRLSGSFIDATGYVVGVSHTIGPLGKVIVDNTTIVGGRKHAIRNNPEAPTVPQDIQTMGFFAAPTENESEIRDCVVKGFSRAIVVQGQRNRVVGNTIEDPVELWFQGGSSQARDFLELSGNKVHTRTPDALSVLGRCGRIDNFSNLEIYDNTLLRVMRIDPGNVLVPENTTHSTVFIDLLNASATGFARNNRAPAGTIPVRTGATGVALYQNQGHHLRPLLTTTDVGNVTGGEDNLHTHAIPPFNLNTPGAAVRTTFTGTTKSNANAKTLKVWIGSEPVMTKSLTPGIDGAWQVEVVLIAIAPTPTVPSQRYTVRLIECDTAGSGAPTVAGIAAGTTAQPSNAQIIVKTTATAVATNDVIAQVGVSESLEGRHFVFT